jgi:CHAD domain-containing protein
VARLQTARTVYELLAEDGTVLAELADDQVRAQVLDADGQEAEVSVWREIEVEQRDGGPEVLVAVAEELQRAGARPATVGSKVAQLLGDRLADGPDLPPEDQTDGVRRRSPAGDVVRAYLATHVEAMLAADPRVRLDEPDSVHKMRVATRRLRSTLRSFRVVLDEDRARDLDARLKTLAATLGVPRDKEVQLERLLGELDEQPDTLVLGPVRARLEERLGSERLRGHDAALAELKSRTYRQLVDDLIDFVRTGISAPPATEPARDVLPKLVAKRYRRLDRRVRDALDLDGAAADEALHGARKAAKRARYAAEALVPVWGADAKAMAKQMEAVQEVLGEHQDSVVAQELLRDLGVATQAAADESAFTFGLLTGLEQAAARDSRHTFETVWAEASRRKHRRWLR